MFLREQRSEFFSLSGIQGQDKVPPSDEIFAFLLPFPLGKRPEQFLLPSPQQEAARRLGSRLLLFYCSFSKTSLATSAAVIAVGHPE